MKELKGLKKHNNVLTGRLHSIYICSALYLEPSYPLVRAFSVPLCFSKAILVARV